MGQICVLILLFQLCIGALGGLLIQKQAKGSGAGAAHVGTQRAALDEDIFDVPDTAALALGENILKWHHGVPTAEEYQTAIAEIEARIESLK